MKTTPRNTIPAKYAENVVRTVDLTDSDSLMNW